MRIGVNIPNDLMKRLEPLKPELNISQVCREALEAKAASYEQMLARLDDGIRAAVGRIWEQEQDFLAAIEVDWEMLAYEDAEAWVKAAGWKDWEYLHHRQDIIGRQGRPAWEVPPPHLSRVKDFMERRGELSERMRRQGDDFFDWLYAEQGGIDFAAAEREYMTAWLAYTNAVWKLVIQRREEHYRRLLAERGMPPDAEVPERLFGHAQPQEEPPVQVVPHHAGYAPGVDPLKLNHLIGDLDVEDFLVKRERLQ